VLDALASTANLLKTNGWHAGALVDVAVAGVVDAVLDEEDGRNWV
jgi:membrane-bound lytic murein transglycosylase B